MFRLLQQRLDANVQKPESQSPGGLPTTEAADSVQQDATSNQQDPSTLSSSPLLVSTPVRPILLDNIHETSYTETSFLICCKSAHLMSKKAFSVQAQLQLMPKRTVKLTLTVYTNSEVSSDSEISSDDSSDDSNIDNSVSILTVSETQDTTIPTSTTESVNGEPANCASPVLSNQSENKSQDLDSLLASSVPTATEETRSSVVDELIADKVSLLKQLTEKEAELETEREKVFKLKKDLQLMKLHLSDKDEDIRVLERENSQSKCDLSKSKRQSSKLQRQREIIDKNNFEGKTKRRQLDSENSTLRAQNCELTERLDCLSDELVVMTAKCAGLQGPSTNSSYAEAVASIPETALSLPQPRKLSSVSRKQQPSHPGGARPKEKKHQQDSQKAKTVKSGVSRSNTRPHSLSKTRNQKPRKLRVTVIGASNLRNVSSKLQTKNCDTIALYVNPGCKIQDLQNGVKDMVTKDTDVAVLHLGMNNALGTESDRQCMDNCYDALEKIEHQHESAHPGVPLLV